jgi:hypothetical protein
MKLFVCGFALVAIGAASSEAQRKHTSDTTRILGAADAAMSGPMSTNAKRHMRMTPTRQATREDSALALAVAAELRDALARYTDTTAAVADGFEMFMPNVKEQRVYHFTNRRNALLEAFRFDPARPTSLIYRRAASGTLELIGGMYTAPRLMRTARLDGRVPLSIASWHQHVNWCVPEKSQNERWLERRNGAPLFGPESPIATRAECEAVGGVFHPNVFGWMIHANVFLGSDLQTVFGHEH